MIRGPGRTGDGAVRHLPGCVGAPAQRRLRGSQSEVLFRAAATSSFDAFFIVRGEPEGLRLMRLNSHAEALLGCEAREAEGQLLSDFPHVAFIAPLPLCEQVWRTGRPHDEELKHEGTGGMGAAGSGASSTRWATAWPSWCGTSPSSARTSCACGSTSAWRPSACWPRAWRTRSTTRWPSCSSNLHYIEKELRRLKLRRADLGEMMEAITDAREGAERMRGIVQSLRALARGRLGHHPADGSARGAGQLGPAGLRAAAQPGRAGAGLRRGAAGAGQPGAAVPGLRQPADQRHAGAAGPRAEAGAAGDRGCTTLAR